MKTYRITLYDLSQFEVQAHTMIGALISAEQVAYEKNLEIIQIERVMGI